MELEPVSRPAISMSRARWRYRQASTSASPACQACPEHPSNVSGRDEARKLLAEGGDPGAKRQAEKEAKSDTFEAIALEWYGKFSPGWAKGHAEKISKMGVRFISQTPTGLPKYSRPILPSPSPSAIS